MPFLVVMKILYQLKTKGKSSRPPFVFHEYCEIGSGLISSILFSPFSEQYVSANISIRFKFFQFGIFNKVSVHVHREESFISICQPLVVVYKFMTKRAKYVLQLSVLDEQGYCVFLWVVIAGWDEWIKNRIVSLVKSYSWNWINLDTIVPEKLNYVVCVVLKSYHDDIYH